MTEHSKSAYGENPIAGKMAARWAVAAVVGGIMLSMVLTEWGEDVALAVSLLGFLVLVFVRRRT